MALISPNDPGSMNPLFKTIPLNVPTLLQWGENKVLCIIYRRCFKPKINLINIHIKYLATNSLGLVTSIPNGSISFFQDELPSVIITPVHDFPIYFGWSKVWPLLSQMIREA